MAEVLDKDQSESTSPVSSQSASTETVAPTSNKTALGILESALAAAEDETDVAAAKIVRAEAAAELDEFDETAPIANGEEGEGLADLEGNKAEMELQQLEEQVMSKSYFQLSSYLIPFLF